MTEYAPPLKDMQFVLDHVAGLGAVASLPGYEEATPDMAAAILEEGGKFAAGVLAPLNATGDRDGVRLENGVLTTAEGFPAAYRAFVEAGWPALQFDPGHGGQGLPWLLSTAAMELWNTANLSFALCPMLTQGAAEMLSLYGTEEQKRVYLPRMVSGAWTGTMNLTEPQAGTDLGEIRTRAEPAGDGRFRIKGQKIFITFGEHDMAENIVHMVLARLPDAPRGVRGISLFLVPKYLPDSAGRPGERNDLRCLSAERKLGIHAAPTCVMGFGEGEGEGAIGWLVGEENQGLGHMFAMMNNERLAVGLQGVAIMERAYQQAVGFARQRIQGRDEATGQPGTPIIRHADVRRMLLTMRAKTEAGRALAYTAAAMLDTARRHPEEAVRNEENALVEFLTPIVKAWPTDAAVETASIGIQIHGGMGFIEETGAAQHYRDARILPIYEGTNGIQARDLVGRKVLRDGGETARRFIARLRRGEAALAAFHRDPAIAAIRARLVDGIDALSESTEWLLHAGKEDAQRPMAAAAPYLSLAGTVAGAWLLGRGAAAARQALDADGEAGDSAFLEAKIATARFFAEHLLPPAIALRDTVARGSDPVLALPVEAF
jgi:alkylation response protein AidB-like acyl-CoA dehydrogenase